MGKVSSLILLFLVGLGLSFLGNEILTIAACFVLGVILDQRSKSEKKDAAKSSTHKVRSVIRCRNCGAPSPANVRFCAGCGSKIGTSLGVSSAKSARRYTPEEIMAKLEILEDPEEYSRSVRDLLMIDELGRYWSIGVQTANWYVHQDGDWIVDQPTNPLRIIRGGQVFFQSQTFQSRCPRCNESIVPGSMYCRRCGLGLAASSYAAGERYLPETKVEYVGRRDGIKLCTFCGSENDPSDRFCIICGRLIQA